MGIEIIILAAAAIFVLFRLYSVLGKQKGAPPPSFGQQSQKSEKPHPVLVHSDNDDRFDEEDESSGFEQIARADPNFTQREFLVGAKSAYEMIVRAFADGDRERLVTLLTNDVFNDYDAAIKAREESGAAPFEFMRLKNASLENGELNGSMAEVSVLFESELSNEERIISTREIWTFERDTQSRDPNWRLADVSEA